MPDKALITDLITSVIAFLIEEFKFPAVIFTILIIIWFLWKTPPNKQSKGKESEVETSANVYGFWDNWLKWPNNEYAAVIEQESSEAVATDRNLPRKSVGMVQVRLDGEYLILKVDSGNVKDGFLITVRNIESGEDVALAVPAGTLPDSQLAQLKNGKWPRSKLCMEINAELICGDIHRATLVSYQVIKDDT